MRYSRSPERIATLEAGFSMLELVVALALLALILAAMPGLVSMSRRAWLSAAVVERTSSEAVIESFLAERVAAAMPLLKKQEDGALRIAFSGSEDGIRFVTPVTDGPMGTGLFELEIAARLVPSGRTGLVLHWQPFTPDQRAVASAERVLLPDVEGFAVRYFGNVAESGRREWSASWAEAQDLPELIEMSLTARGGVRHTRVVTMLSRNVP